MFAAPDSPPLFSFCAVDGRTEAIRDPAAAPNEPHP
jgi:hypothetical protein